MTRKEKYNFYKSQGLCPRCGKNKAKEGRTYCESCLTWHKEYIDNLRSKKICPLCLKNELWGDEKNCPECLAKAYEKNREYRDKNRDTLRAKSNMRSKNRIIRRKEQGLCTRCGKRNATVGNSTCQMCRYKATEYSHTLERYLGIGKGHRA